MQQQLAPDVPRILARFGIEVVRAQGPELWALCPAHEDSHASWSINVHNGLHSCFSCGFQGGAAALVLQMLGAWELAWSPGDAWRWLQAQGLLMGQGALGLSVELHLAGGRPARGFQMPLGVVEAPLERWPTPARRYTESRGITATQVRRWRLGYAVDGRLGGRVVFPFYDARGGLGGYSARTFTGDELRYITPRKEERPQEGALFGELHWPASWERKRLVVVEGAIDALAVERAAAMHVAGIPGVKRACNPRVLAKLSTWAEVVLLTDPDDAGEWAANELRGYLGRHCKVKRGLLPEGKDAAECTPQQIFQAVQ